jgi:hypothetical protein
MNTPKTTITIDGTTKTLKDWCKQYKISDSVVRSRLRLGWDVKRALTEPTKRYRLR